MCRKSKQLCWEPLLPLFTWRETQSKCVWTHPFSVTFSTTYVRTCNNTFGRILTNCLNVTLFLVHFFGHSWHFTTLTYNFSSLPFRLAAIVESTGAAAYHGFLPTLVRDCVVAFTSSVPLPDFPLTFSTALFSFLYHLATYETSKSVLDLVFTKYHVYMCVLM